MFTTIHSFLLFFIPATILFILGIIFEDKLIQFEDGIKNAIRRSLKKKSTHRQVKQLPSKKQNLSVRPNTVQKHRINKAA